MFGYPTYFFTFLFVFSCNLKHDDSQDKALYTVLTKEDTGITFRNTLEESAHLNGIVYQYYYNGAGVAVADFNNDDLPDIYFISNRRANTLYLNQGDLKFKNVTEVSNSQGAFGLPTGVTVVDINNDGLMDIYICKSGRMNNKEHLRNELLVNQGLDKDGIPIFKEMAKEYQLDLTYNSTQASFFDYDRDGDLDMFLINHGINFIATNKSVKAMNGNSLAPGEKLLRNDEGKFTDVTSSSGIVNSPIGLFTLGVSVGDINNDGWPDIYTGNDYTEKDHLYLNNQDGTFKETALEAFGHIPNFSMGTDVADMNNDGLLDIMSLDMASNDNYVQKTSMAGMSTDLFMENVALGLHYQYMYNALQMNNGMQEKSNVPLFSDVAQISGLSSTDWSWSPLLFDMDNDGLKDIFISNGVKRDFRDKDFANYHKKKQAEAAKNGIANREAYMNGLLSKMPSRKNENCFFRNNSALNFEKITLQQPRTSSNGAAYADFDNDGDLDVVVNNTDDYSFIYRNNSEGLNNYIKIQLKGSGKNKNAIGTKVKIATGSGSQISEHYFTRGFQSAMANTLHFGLGNDMAVDTVTVTWPDGSRQYVYDQPANQTVVIAYNPTDSTPLVIEKSKLFKDITDASAIKFKHTENSYNDYENELLIPHKMSQFGPALAVADINGDGLDDFFVGGAKEQSGAIYLQLIDGRFALATNALLEKDKEYEDTGALFFDADNDGDQDLYVVSGGNEALPNSPFYEDRFYENLGGGKFIKNQNAIPKVTSSGLKVAAGDYDNDGDLDLFVGSRMLPMNYGMSSKSSVLENQSDVGQIKFIDVTEKIIPDLSQYKMVTDAVWIDYDNDTLLDLVITSEWGTLDLFKNTKHGFVNQSALKKTDDQKGWWFSIAADDFDEDGDIDFIAGNLGLNYKYKASEAEPFHLYLNDFDQNSSKDIVMAYHQDSKLYPLRGRECSSNQMPFIKQKFKTYDAFGKANMEEIYGDKLKESLHFTATNFATGIFKNAENKWFEFMAFQNEVQISSVNKILCSDFDGDNIKDLLLFGNLYVSEVETPRNDASYGHFMKGNKQGRFKAIPAKESGLYIKGDVKNAALIHIGAKNRNKKAVLVARNDDFLMLIKIDNQ